MTLRITYIRIPYAPIFPSINPSASYSTLTLLSLYYLYIVPVLLWYNAGDQVRKETERTVP